MSQCALVPAESSLAIGNGRGDLQSPHTAEGPGRTLTRVLSVKLSLEPDQWSRLRELAWQSMRYKNEFIRARWAEAMGLCERQDIKNDVTKKVRAEKKAELSGVVYSAAEREVQAAWSRHGKHIMAGAPMPQWRQNDNLSIRGHKDRNQSGVRLEIIGGEFIADLQVQSKDCPTGCWMRVQIASGTSTDEYQSPLLRDMSAGTIPILKGTIVFVPTKGKSFLKLAYSVPVVLPPVGKRIATLGPISKDGRLLLRSELSTLDLTQEFVTVKKRKSDWDLIRRRAFRQIGRRRGSARTKRKLMATNSFDDWCKTFSHQLSRRIIDWCRAEGVGRLVVLDLHGGDWPAFRFVEMLKYKGDESGVMVEQDTASLDDESTKRAAKNAAKKEQKKAREIGTAVRRLQAELT